MLIPSSHILFVLLLCNHIQKDIFWGILTIASLHSPLIIYTLCSKWWRWLWEGMCAILKTDDQDQPHHRTLFIFIFVFTLLKGNPSCYFFFFFLPLLNACLKEKAAIVQGPAGGFWSMQCGLIKSWGRLKY